MPTIIFSSSKGGAGKTTAAVVLASEFAEQGQAKGLRVALVDADPNQHSAAWAAKEGKPENIDALSVGKDDDILQVIEEAQRNAAFVIVDLEGAASSTVIGAIALADLVVVPCQPSQNDAREAAKTIKQIQYAAKVSRRTIPFVVVFSRISAAIFTKTNKHLAAEFESAGVDVLETALIDREAFKSIFSFGGTVNTLERKNTREAAGPEKAAENVRAFAEDIKRRLLKSQQQETGRVAHA